MIASLCAFLVGAFDHQHNGLVAVGAPGERGFIVWCTLPRELKKCEPLSRKVPISEAHHASSLG
jgi:hypothetical protein